MSKRLKLLSGLFVESECSEYNVLPNAALVVATSMNSWHNYPLFQFYLGLQDDKHVRIPGFHEEWIDKYLECDFYIHFRMTRITFEKIIHLMKPHFHDPKYRGGAHKCLSLEKSFQITLWYLSKGSTLETIGEKFNVTSKTVYYAVSHVLDIFNKLISTVVKWPSERECQKIEQTFKDIAGFPGVIGALDGCHFRAMVPIKQHDSYQDRHFQHSISMQAICLKNLVFTNISAGYPGSLHDARILKESNISRAVNRAQMFYNKYHLVADSAYPCKEWIMTPYRMAANMTRTQRNYNTVLSKTRVFIEHAFGVLKGRWRILQYINVYTIQRATKIIIACCVLHNLCISNEDIFDF